MSGAIPISSIVVTPTTAAPDPACVAFAKINGLYLWCKRSEGEQPITSLCVLYGDESVPEGYERIEENLAPKNVEGEFIYLAFSKKKEKGTDLMDVKIVEADGNTGEAYVRIEKELNKFVQNPKEKLYLCCKYLNAGMKFL